jgi:hypothetical protein
MTEPTSAPDLSDHPGARLLLLMERMYEISPEYRAAVDARAQARDGKEASHGLS